MDFDLGSGGFDSPIPHDPAQLDFARRAYYAQLTHIDHQLNRIFMALFESGVWQNTAILFTADHGEMLFDHNLTAKGFGVDGSARVPFLLRLPFSEAWRGRASTHSVAQPVELRDILPTFCDIAGVNVPDTVDGCSVLPLCKGESTGWREYLHGEHFLGERSSQWIIDGREKYIWYSQTGRELLFDIASDPTELHDLAREQPDRVAYWRAKLIRELDGREEGFVENGELQVGRKQRPTLSHAGTRGEG